VTAVRQPELGRMLQRTGDGAFATDPDGRIVAWNRAAERILGFPARDVVNRTCCEVFGGEDDAGNRLCYPGCHIRSLVGLKEPVASYEMRTHSRTGKVVWLSVSVLPLPAADERAPVVVHLFRDITATKELLTLVHERIAAVGGDRPGEPVADGALTRREREILRLLAQGLDTAATADRLHVSRATVRNHVQNIFAKLGVHSRLAAVAYATRHRLV
jgi:PAS domain S-box-containing protein